MLNPRKTPSSYHHQWYNEYQNLPPNFHFLLVKPFNLPNSFILKNIKFCFKWFIFRLRIEFKFRKLVVLVGYYQIFSYGDEGRKGGRKGRILLTDLQKVSEVHQSEWPSSWGIRGYWVWGGLGVEGAQEEGEEGPPDKLRESFWKVNV